MFVVDTNVLLHAADQYSPFHARCEELLETWRNQQAAWFTTWGVCYEFLRVATHPAVFRNPWSAADAWSFLEALLDSSGLELLVPTERHRAVMAEVLGEIPYLAGNIMHDAHTAILMREHGVKRIYTRDTDFHRFTFLEPVDPMQVSNPQH